ncbi:Ni-sirohydrochlorin a,c-diamide synthase [Methanosarcinales archaeon]|nr:MAG: Ni-sirohydrochlorin a,c-diamide synthase [Methanosarcinales archaeon]
MTQLLNLPRVVLAADHSSSGKTTISMGIMAALKDMGYTVQPFKVGLDYIDPGYHTEITGRPARNLDGYLCKSHTIHEIFQHASKGSDISIIEGVRGLYEGLDATSDTGSTAQIAKILDSPVILIINARSITRSAAAIVKGYAAFDPGVKILGVILNNIGSASHSKKAKKAIETYTDIPVIGVIPRDEGMQISMRHLGLMPAIEGRCRLHDFDARLGSVKSITKQGVDMQQLLEIARSAPPLPELPPTLYVQHRKPPVVRIGVALDEAFNFYYRDNLELLELEGSKIVYFSPLHDKKIPEVDGLYIGGGYPELFAAELEKNKTMRESIYNASQSGCPIFGECGGLMYLTRNIVTIRLNHSKYHMAKVEPGSYEMVGALPGNTHLTHKRVVTYTVARIMKDTPIGVKNTSIKAHEFHHSEILGLPEDATFAIKTERGTGIYNKQDGLMQKNTIATYLHIHAASYPRFATSFVEKCKQYKQRR